MFGRMYSLRNGYRTKQWKINSPIEVKKSLWAYREWKRKLNRNQHKPILKETETVTHLTQYNAQHLPDNVLKGLAHRMRSATSRRAMSFKFEHIVFNVCTHTGGAIRRLSAAHSNDCLERCSRRGAARRGAARSVCEPLKKLFFCLLRLSHNKILQPILRARKMHY